MVPTLLRLDRFCLPPFSATCFPAASSPATIPASACCLPPLGWVHCCWLPVPLPATCLPACRRLRLHCSRLFSARLLPAATHCTCHASHCCHCCHHCMPLPSFLPHLHTRCTTAGQFTCHTVPHRLPPPAWFTTTGLHCLHLHHHHCLPALPGFHLPLHQGAAPGWFLRFWLQHVACHAGQRNMAWLWFPSFRFYHRLPPPTYHHLWFGNANMYVLGSYTFAFG